jgi:general stress protein 26
MADKPKTDAEKMEKLGALIKGVEMGMMTTVAADGSLHSRPMAYQHPEGAFDGTLYFFTSAGSGKVAEVTRDPRVNVSFSSPKTQDYVSVSGTARLSRDAALLKQLWNPWLKAWFPDELADPELALLIMETEQAEYWDSPNSAALHLIGVVKATITGQPMSGGENETINR